MAPRKVTVFGGTGFLGQRVVQRLLERDFSVRVAVRHPERIAALFPALHLDAIQADVNDARSVAAAVAAVEGVVNAVSLYVESGQQTFHSVHVTGAARVARLAREEGVKHLIHVSGIGSDAGSASPYIRSRGEGEKVVRDAFPAATLIRPSVMFGRGDAFVCAICPSFPCSDAAKLSCRRNNYIKHNFVQRSDRSRKVRVCAVAEYDGKEESLKQSLGRTLVGSIGPVCSAALRKLAVRVESKQNR